MMRSALAWMLWAVGHLISGPMVRFDRCVWMYPAYSRIMVASSDLQGQRRGPWQNVEDADG